METTFSTMAIWIGLAWFFDWRIDPQGTVIIGGAVVILLAGCIYSLEKSVGSLEERLRELEERLAEDVGDE